jgi:hypothetical protein
LETGEVVILINGIVMEQDPDKGYARYAALFQVFLQLRRHHKDNNHNEVDPQASARVKDLESSESWNREPKRK